MEHRELGRTGLRVSILGFGASPLGNVFGAVSDSEAVQTVHAAVEGGINFFDVSPYYGRTLAEERLGAALAGRRDRVIVATKCGRYGTDSFDFSQARVKTSIDESLRRLRTDYVDMLTAHDIEFGDRGQVIEETIPAMRELQKQGKVRCVGISGLPLRMLADVAQRANVDYVLSYCHYNLLSRDLDNRLTPVLKERQIGLINASPLHMGILAPGGPPAWHPAPPEVKAAGEKVVRVCEESGVEAAAVALRFCLDHPYVSSTLVGMSSPAEVAQNLGAIDFRIPSGLMERIEAAVALVHGRTWPSGRPENSDV